jgi:hypothetical protein
MLIDTCRWRQQGGKFGVFLIKKHDRFIASTLQESYIIISIIQRRVSMPSVLRQLHTVNSAAKFYVLKWNKNEHPF